MDRLHPVRLLARTDAEISTVLHSFFLFHFDEATNKLVVDSKHPQVRRNIEAVEDGLRGLIMEVLPVTNSVEASHSFVITNHDGRLYVFVRKVEQSFIAVVTTLPMTTFSRNLLKVLESEPSESILATIYILCEMPIFPIPDMTYSFEFSQERRLEISFSCLEYVNDIDMDLVVQMVLTPVMIVKAWEALIVERRVLVISRNESLLVPCCEFLRRLVSPMPYTGTFIPNLPHSGFEAVEAPGTFIIGANATALREANKDLTGLVIMDLDRQTIRAVASTADDPYYAAPLFLLDKLIDTVAEVMTGSVARWCDRLHDGHHAAPHGTSAMHERTATLVNLFMQTNLLMLSAQFCSIKAFFRSSFKVDERVQACFQGLSELKDLVLKSFHMSFTKINDIYVGCLQRWKDTDIDNVDALHHTIPCWLEMDNKIFAVYEYADDLPLVILRVDELEAVLASSLEPEGYVFEVLLRNQTCYRFTTADKDSRRLWMGAIEERINSLLKGSSTYPAGSMPYGALAVNATMQGTYYTTNTHYLANEMYLSSPTYPSNNQVNDSIGSPSQPNNESHLQDNLNSNSQGDKYSQDIINSNLLLNPPNYPDLSDRETLSRYFEFRDVVRNTQLVMNLYATTECERFESLFTQRGESLFSFMFDDHSYEYGMSRHIAKVGSTTDVLMQMKKELAEMSKGIISKCSNNHSGSKKSDSKMSVSGGLDQEMSSSGKLPEEQLMYRQKLTAEETAELNVDAQQSHIESSNRDEKFTRPGLFKRLFSFHSSASKTDVRDQLSQLGVDELHRSEELVKLNEREMRRKYAQDIKDKMMITAMAHSRCLAELSAAIVEDRLAAFYKYFGSSSTGTNESVNGSNRNSHRNAGMAVDSSKERASSDRHQQGGYEIRHNVAQLTKAVMSRWDRSYLDSYMAAGAANGNNTPNASPMRQQSEGVTSLWSSSLAGQRTSSKLSAVNDVGASGEGVESVSGFYQKLVSLLVPSVLPMRRNSATRVMSADPNFSSAISSKKLLRFDGSSANKSTRFTENSSCMTTDSRRNAEEDLVRVNTVPMDDRLPFQNQGSFFNNNDMHMSSSLTESVVYDALDVASASLSALPVIASTLSIVGMVDDSRQDENSKVIDRIEAARGEIATAEEIDVVTATAVSAVEVEGGEGDFELSMDLIFDDQATGLLQRYYEQLHMTVKQVVKEAHAAKLAHVGNEQEASAATNTAVNSFGAATATSSGENTVMYVAHLKPVLEALYGYTLHSAGEHQEALHLYGRSNLVDQRRISQCLLQLFVSQASHQESFVRTFSELSFICQALDIKMTLGMHAYRLCLELVHTELRESLGGVNASFDQSLMLRGFHHLPKTSLMGLSGKSHRHEKRSRSKSFKRVEFTWVENESKSEIVNEAYLCTKLDSTWHPCEISSDLLTKLREVLKTYVQSPSAEKFTVKANGLCKMRINPQSLQDIQHLSAFKKFEIECCQLQKLDLANLKTNEKLLFFVNIYNMLMIHGTLKRGGIGSSHLDRMPFMRATKYNIGGLNFSLLDIEHGVLRNASNPPILLGPLSFDMSFSDRDPRRKFALEEPRPNVSFCLFQASATSPALCVLTDAKNVEKDMVRLSRQFFLETVKFDTAHRTIVLPELLRVYWADFGKKQSDVLKYITSISGSQFATRIREYVNTLDTGAIKTSFMGFDWTPMFVLNDK